MTIYDINYRLKILEKELLVTLVDDLTKATYASTILKGEDFYYYPEVFETIVDCTVENKNVETEFLSKGISLYEFSGLRSARPLEVICRDIKETANARRVYDILEKSMRDVPYSGVDNFVATMQQNLLKGVQQAEAEESTIASIISEYRKQQQIYTDKFLNGHKLIGLSTGYNKLDDVIDGIRPGHFWVIGGYTSMGKTSASLNIVASLVKQKKRVVYFSLEMSKVDILSKLIGILTNISGTTILKNFPHDTQAVESAIKKLEESQIAIYNNKADLSEIQYTMFEENLKQPVDLFVIDFIQNVKVKGSKSDYETVTTASLEFQSIAQKLGVPIIVLSQISNEGARNSSDTVMSFKGSGAIAAAADLAIEIMSSETTSLEFRQKLYKGDKVKMKWMIRKNRHGRVGTMEMLFNGRTGIFETSDFENLTS